MKIAVITGSSSGMGREFVKQVVKYHSLDEIWIIARRKQRLLDLKNIDPSRIRVISMDLTQRENFDKFKLLLAKKSPEVKLLINGAGMGKIGYFENYSLSDINNMIDLNCTALVTMSHLILPYLSQGSRLIQICSTSAFLPLPAFSIYGATKSFVLNFTLALRNELKDKQINVTAVCPFWVTDTEFISKAEKTKGGDAISNFYLSSNSKDVVMKALKDSKNNKAISTYGLASTVIRYASKISPECLNIFLWNKYRKI